jgi:hypothetical protein
MATNGLNPNWDERLTITVGEKSGDMIGQSDRVIQAALDYVARLGGGTVKVLPGLTRFAMPSGCHPEFACWAAAADSVITRLRR